jgi:hypothetical protein
MGGENNVEPFPPLYSVLLTFRRYHRFIVNFSSLARACRLRAGWIKAAHPAWARGANIKRGGVGYVYLTQFSDLGLSQPFQPT